MLAESQALALSAQFKGHAKSQSNFLERHLICWGKRSWSTEGHWECVPCFHCMMKKKSLGEAHISGMEHIDRKCDRQTTTQLCLIETELLKKIVRQAPYEIPDWRDQRKRKGFCEALSAQQELPQTRSVSNLSNVVRKSHVPSSMSYILYALFTHVILTRLTISTLYLLPKKQTTTTGLISRFTQLESISLLFSASLFLSFYLNSWYARGRKMCGYHSYMCCPISLQRVGNTTIRAKGGGRAMLWCATLGYACSMWRPIFK